MSVGGLLAHRILCSIDILNKIRIIYACMEEREEVKEGECKVHKF